MPLPAEVVATPEACESTASVGEEKRKRQAVDIADIFMNTPVPENRLERLIADLPEVSIPEISAELEKVLSVLRRRRR